MANYTGNGREWVAEGKVLFLHVLSFTEKDKSGFGSWSLFIDVSFALFSGAVLTVLVIGPKTLNLLSHRWLELDASPWQAVLEAVRS